MKSGTLSPSSSPDTPRCQRCGSAVRPAAAYCCLGCALRHKVPVDEKGQYPVNGALVTSLIVGFVFFNELLLWGAAELVRADGRLDLAAKLAWASAGIGLGAWILTVGVQWAQRVLSARDGIVAALTLVIHLSAFRAAPPVIGQMAAANVVLLLWSCRGLARGRAK